MLFNSHAEFILAFIYKEIPKQIRNDEKPNGHAELVSASRIWIPKLSWIIVSLTSHKTILNCFVRQSTKSASSE